MQHNSSNIKLTLAYNGTPFYGYQKIGEGPTVESEVAGALQKVICENPKLQGSSRTDRGVHAKCQVINFFLTKPFDLTKLKAGLNANLPKEIRILSVEEMDHSFHPTLSAKSKTYSYKIDNGRARCPFRGGDAWYIHSPLNIEDMRRGAAHLVGRHDFAAFATLGHHEETTRQIYSIEVDQEDDLITLTIKGKSFLYRMVRGIVGTLVYVGKGKLKPTDCQKILLSCDRKSGGPSAPPHGLTLTQIDY